MIFAIGDVHGCADELRLLINLLPLSRDATVVFTGDYVDRGPSSRSVIDTIFELRQLANVVTLMGNHEAMFLDYLADPTSAAAGTFILNGGSATLASYANDKGEIHIPEDHVAFLRNLEIQYQTREHVFVHAGLPLTPLSQIDPTSEHDKAVMLWTRGKFLTTSYDWGKVVVHGHTPVRRATLWPNRINIDTGCVFNNRLTGIALPGDRTFSVRRQPRPERVVLKDPGGIRAAKRFTGTIPVMVHRDGKLHPFVTVDYSELGMYLRSMDLSDNYRFQIGERIEGFVGADAISQVKFVGVIVRSRIDDLGIHYGVKLLDNDYPELHDD